MATGNRRKHLELTFSLFFFSCELSNFLVNIYLLKYGTAQTEHGRDLSMSIVTKTPHKYMYYE